MSYTTKASDFLTTREAAELLRVTERTILNFRKAGKLAYQKLGSNVRFGREHVLALMGPATVTAPKSWQATRWTSDASGASRLDHAPRPQVGVRKKIETEDDLARVRGWVSRQHDDERLLDRIVRLLRGGSAVARIACLTDALAWDAYRIVAGLRFRREDGPAVVEALPLLAAAA
jgi:excisionase family DNA binding protein